MLDEAVTSISLVVPVEETAAGKKNGWPKKFKASASSLSGFLLSCIADP